MDRSLYYRQNETFMIHILTLVTRTYETWTLGYGHLGTDTWRRTLGNGHLETDIWRRTLGNGHLETDTWERTICESLSVIVCYKIEEHKKYKIHSYK